MPKNSPQNKPKKSFSEKFKLIIKIFFETLRLSAFTLGGGYVIVGLIKKRMVEQLHWISEEEMMNMVSLSQACPGAIAVNTSIMVGYNLAGPVGAIASVLGTVLPPLIIMSVLAVIYNIFIDYKPVEFFMRGMQAGVAAMMADVVISTCMTVFKERNIFSAIIMLASFAAVMFFNVNTIWIILVGGTLGILIHFFITKKETKEGGDKK